ncbi:hypothetical protein H4219_004269 [Mycoemilia scoparia]|uniref:Phospho-2-dehydro-3-deoxyheptonate aldolase n=1 Tax=Mycoemilia scoparia TaxID=417184 RepID=A0A9W8DRE7_9FUNG|nr:hypothetical protein H4219_004269 [Mycoemilia scoparia]
MTSPTRTPSASSPNLPSLDDAWSPDSWRTKPIKQDVVYTDREALDSAINRIRDLPPLVAPEEVDKLRDLLKDVSEGRAFLLQGGDCAESFDYCNSSQIEDKLKILLQMSLVLIWGMRLPVVRIARMAGQYAKPRSSSHEEIDGKKVLSYRGDNVNGIDPNDRDPDPQRLLMAYFHSVATLNHIRSLVNTGFADLHHPNSWDLGYVKDDSARDHYKAVINSMLDSISFMKTIGADQSSEVLKTIDLFISHEGLLLEYEQALTRKALNPAARALLGKPATIFDGVESPPFKPKDFVGHLRSWYNLSTHFLWIGDRTRQIDGAHVEYFRGIRNPIGVKVGPSMAPEELPRLLDILDPDNEPGKVTLITRYGASKIEKYLPAHIRAVKATSHKVVWCCDPCHGNTTTSSTGYKTRSFGAILEEIEKSITIHQNNDSLLNGIHLELTGDHVTECTGGSENLCEGDLSSNYRSFCDPRLNYLQSLDIAFKISKNYENSRQAGSM